MTKSDDYFTGNVCRLTAAERLAKRFHFDPVELDEVVHANGNCAMPASRSTMAGELGAREQQLILSEANYLARINGGDEITEYESADWSGRRALIFALLSAIGRYFWGQNWQFPEDGFIKIGGEWTFEPGTDVDFVVSAMEIISPGVTIREIYEGLGVFHEYVDVDAYLAGENLITG